MTHIETVAEKGSIGSLLFDTDRHDKIAQLLNSEQEDQQNLQDLTEVGQVPCIAVDDFPPETPVSAVSDLEQFSAYPEVSKNLTDLWGVAVDQGRAGKGVEVIFSGVALVNLTQIDPEHKKVTADGNNLVTSDSGCADLLWYNPNGKSLVRIGVLVPVPLKVSRVLEFRATNSMTADGLEVEIVRAHPGVLIDNNEEAVAIGDEITVLDPYNHWPQAEEYSRGYAIKASGNSLWEIATCTLPSRQLRVVIDTCLKWNDETTDVQLPEHYSHYPSVLPPEMEEVPSGEEGVDPTYKLEVSNFYKLQAVHSSKVVIERFDGTAFADEEFKEDIPTWIITRVEKPIARWAKFAKNSSSWDLVSYKEGFDPSGCDSDRVICPFDCNCLEDGEEVWGFYSPSDDKYILISSASALLGGPEFRNLVIDVTKKEDCKLEKTQEMLATFKCDTNEPAKTEIPIATVSQSVVTGLSLGYGGLCASTATILVCKSTSGGSSCIEVEDCPDSCEWGEATYITMEGENGTYYWALQTPCPDGCEPGDPGEAVGPAGATTTVPCSGQE